MRRALVWALALTLVLALLPATVLATEPDNRNVPVTADVSPTYTVTVPASIDFGSLTPGSGRKSVGFKVTAAGVYIEDGAFIDVSVRGNGPGGAFTLFDMGGSGPNPLAYGLFKGSAPIEAGGLYHRFAGSGKANGSVRINTNAIEYAGAYRGTVIFSIGYVPPIVQSVPGDEVAYLAGWSTPKTHETRGLHVSAEIGFKNWKVSELTSLQMSIYKSGGRLSTITLIDPNQYDTKNITGSFYKDALAPEATSSSWYLEPVGDANWSDHVFDTIVAKVVKDGKTYIFKSTDLRN